jgi:hypothetical protein
MVLEAAVEASLPSNPTLLAVPSSHDGVRHRRVADGRVSIREAGVLLQRSGFPSP